MTVAALIEELTRLGVTLTPEGDRLRYRAPAGAITPELKQRIVEQKLEIIAVLNHEDYGAGRPSPENATKPVEERCSEALELLGELTDLYNQRAAVLEYEAGFPRDEAERLAMIETKATETFRCWCRLG